MKQELKEGDWVRYILTDKVGQIEDYSKISTTYSLCLRIVIGLHAREMAFTKEGLSSLHHKHPRFIKCDPPKKKVKKTMERWVNVYHTHESMAHETEERANELAYPYRIACAKLTGEYEVEE